MAKHTPVHCPYCAANRGVAIPSPVYAAAPEFLEALTAAKGTIEYLLANSDTGFAENCIEIISAAIAKAEGRTDEE